MAPQLIAHLLLSFEYALLSHLRFLLSRFQISFSLDSSTLKDLKVAIAHSTALGNIPVNNQRIFHLGRELKTAGRSLETLGVGRLGITVLHVHAVPTASKTTSDNQIASSPQESSTAAPPPVQQRQRQAALVVHQQLPKTRGMTTTVEEVVDLADDSDSDDDDCVVVDEVATRDSKKRRFV